MRSLAAIICAFIVALFPVAPAGAGAGQPGTWLTCTAGSTTGRLDEVTITQGFEELVGPRNIVQAKVTIFPCRPSRSTEVFGLAVYMPGLAGGNVTGYQEFSWGRTVRPTGFAPNQPVEAVCLVTSNLVRIDCVSVMSLRVGEHIFLDTPVCQQWARMNMTPGGGDTSPHCPTCWG